MRNIIDLYLVLGTWYFVLGTWLLVLRAPLYSRQSTKYQVQSELSIASANIRSSEFVILILRALPSTVTTATPSRSTNKLSSVISGPEASSSSSVWYARFRIANRKHCGVSARRNSARETVSIIRPS